MKPCKSSQFQNIWGHAGKPCPTLLIHSVTLSCTPHAQHLSNAANTIHEERSFLSLGVPDGILEHVGVGTHRFIIRHDESVEATIYNVRRSLNLTLNSSRVLKLDNGTKGFMV